MAIQFRCAQCSQPIEVDEQYANQTAACPYCHHTITVPPESSYAPKTSVVARPMEDAASPTGTPQPGLPALPPQLGQWQSAETAQQPQAPNTLGTYAVICTVLALALVAAQVISLVVLLLPVMSTASQPSLTLAPEQQKALEDIMLQHPWLRALQVGATFFGLAGLVLGAVSLRQKPHGNWRGVSSVVLSGLLFLCLCCSMALSLVGGVATLG